MRMLAGEISFSGTKYFLCLYNVREIEYFALLSQVHREDRVKMLSGEKLGHVVIKDVDQIKRYYDEGYVLEGVKRYKKTGKVETYGKTNVLMRVMDAMSYAKSYRFNKEDVLDSYSGVDVGEYIQSFSAGDDNLQYNYEMRDGEYFYLRIKNASIAFELSNMDWKIPLAKLRYVRAERQQEKAVLVATLKTVTYDILAQKLDMSWYKKDGVLQKKYKSITSNRQFELEIMGPMMEKISKCKEDGTVFDVAVDTETTGLFVYNLSPDNPVKDHCVAIPICWKIGESNVIFTDMEYHENADNEYVINRLAQIFENFKDSREIEYWVEEDVGDTNAMTAFGGEQQKKKRIVKKKITITRDLINLIGHNSPFDGRVFFDFGKKFYFNNNTLQMAFDLNPKGVRGSKKLKVLTRKFFGHETPELSDVLGKNNEDKYRYLVDKEVAEIYGCADADYTLALFKVLRKLMPDKMYYWYQKLDVPMDNILYQAEYWGMPTIEDKVVDLANTNEKDIQILKDAMYSYVGVYVKYTNDVNILKASLGAGSITQEEYDEKLRNITVDPNAKYEFEFKPEQLKHVLFDIMGYPVKAYTDKGVPKIDKYAIKKLLQENLGDGETGPRKLVEDIISSAVSRLEYENLKKVNKKKADKYVLVSAEEFNKKKYPLALIIQEYSALNKEYTAYYKPMKENNLEGKIFKGFNMARIETRRISNPGQTMKGALKALVKSYGDDEYLLDFDMAQIEYRIMLSLSHFLPMIKKMCDPEADYHTETASMVNAKPAYRVTKKERKGAKKVGFGVPYGLGDGSMCEGMFGDRSKEHMMETRLTLFKWRKVNKPIIDLLEQARADAFIEWKIDDDMRNFMDAWKKDPKTKEYVLDKNGNKIPVPVSRVQDLLGFYRTFSLENIDLSPKAYERRAQGEFTAEESSIRRKAGNYPIQATAAEIFRIILIRFYKECEKYGIQDKVKWYMLIHDELLCSVKSDVNPMLIYKIVKKACMITMKGHTKYFVGINMGDTWGQCKDDSREAPVYFVDRMIKRYDAGEFDYVKDCRHPWEELIAPLRAQYVEDRIGEVITKLQPQFPEKPLVIKDLLNQFTNYTVRAYVNDYEQNGVPDFVPKKGNEEQESLLEDLKWVKRLETWALSKYEKPVQFVSYDGDVYTVTKVNEKKEQEDSDFDEDFVDYDEMFEKDGESETSYWSFEEGSEDVVYEQESEDESGYQSDEEELVFDFNNKEATDVTAMTVITKKYESIKYLNENLVIQIDDRNTMQRLKMFLSSDVSEKGDRVIFKGPGIFDRWNKVSRSVDKHALDQLVTWMKQKEPILIVENNVFVLANSTKQINILNKTLRKYQGSEYNYYIFNSKELVCNGSFSQQVSLAKLKQMVLEVVKTVEV